jgi:hypothetical protein
MYTNLKNIAPLVKKQFPSFYLEEGDNFLQFVKAYYEWMDTEGPSHKSRRLGEYRDIDETLDEYLDHFMTKYMHGIPKNILSDKRLLEKHIHDLYRSKGTVEGLKLLFRLLYRKDIKVYTPQVDMLKTSDGNWTQRKYVEVLPTNAANHFSYLNKFITGSNSGAIAYVEESIQFYIGNQLVNILYLTDIRVGSNGDEFLIGDYLVYDDFSIYDASYVLGSTRSATVLSSGPNNSFGDTLEVETDTGKGAKFGITKMLDSDASLGYISFKIAYGGNGYRLDSNITMGYKTATHGSGASFKIKALKDTVEIDYNDTIIGDYLSTDIADPDYGVGLNNADIDTILSEALTFEKLEVGTIASLRAMTSGDRKYDGSLFVEVKEPKVIGYGFKDSHGGIWGNNAVITAELATAEGTVDKVKLISSGYGFNTDNDILIFTNTTTNDSEVELQLNTDAVGLEEGYWKDTAGFLNSDKYVQDSYYYQEYSYEIQVEKSLDKYVDVVKKTMHPLGNKLFGRPLVIDNDDTLNIAVQIDSFQTATDTIYDTIKIDEAPYTSEIYWSTSYAVGDLILLEQRWRYVSNNAVYVF